MNEFALPPVPKGVLAAPCSTVRSSIFPSARSSQRPMRDNTILAALRRIGSPKDEMNGHGFRAIAPTILDEVLGVRVERLNTNSHSR
jgi:hypothetical protein